MEIKAPIRRFVFKFSLVFLVFCVLLWFSLISYGLLYYVYIPAIAHVLPVYFKYDSTCHNDVCKNPHDNVTLIEKGHFEILSRGQVYTIELILVMPESERNFNQGMFMVKLDILSQHGEVLKSSRRPALLHYRSPLFKIVYTIFYIPALLTGYSEEKQTLSISLFEDYMEGFYSSAYYAFIEIEARTAEVYSSSLRIHAQFTGLRYMMYYWPILSAVVAVGANFMCLALLLAFIWFKQVMHTPIYINLSRLDQKEQDLVQEIRRSVQEKRSVSPSNGSRMDLPDQPLNERVEELEAGFSQSQEGQQKSQRLPSGFHRMSLDDPYSQNYDREYASDIEDFEHVKVQSRISHPNSNPSSPVMRKWARQKPH